MKTLTANRTVGTLTKDVPFEEVLPLIKKMISCLAGSVRDIYGLEKEDLEQELSLKAYISWQKWEPGSGTKFSTYVYEMLTKHRNYLIRAAKTQRHNGGVCPLSLDSANERDGGKNNPDPYFIYDFCADSRGLNLDEHIYMLEIREIIQKVFMSQNSRAQVAIQGVLAGMTQEAVSREIGITQSQISYYMNIFRRKLREELERGEFDIPYKIKVKPRKKTDV